MSDNTQRLLRRSEDLFGQSERYNSEQLWEELSEFMLNNQYGQFRQSTATSTDIGGGGTTAAGAKRTRRIYDSTALQAVQDLAASFQGTLTNPATVWSKMRFQDQFLNNDAEAVEWLDEVNRRMHIKFSESNFNTEIAKGYQSFVSMANMAIFVEEGEEGNFKFTALHLANIAWAEGADSQVDTVFRKFNLTARQALELWPDDVHDGIKKAAEHSPDKEFEFLHCVFPRDEKKVKLNESGLARGEKRPVASVYIDMTHKRKVEESGYYEMPVLIARWSLMPNEKYGRGPGHLALPDTRTLNRLKQRGLESIDLQVRPPIFANQRDVFGQLDLRPGGISIVKDHGGIREFVSQANSDIFQLNVNELRDSIKSIFFLDKLLLPPRTETGEMTAFEVSQRLEQMNRVLGPTLSRLNHEVLSPLIVRVFKLMLRNGDVPEIPDILQEFGVDLDIVFVNQLARSQQIEDVNMIQQWIQGLLVLAQLNPEVVDNINVDGAAKHAAKILGVPEVAIADAESMQQIRQARQEQAAQQQQLEDQVKIADVVSKQQGGQGGPGSQI